MAPSRSRARASAGCMRPLGSLDFGNSGTGSRLMLGVVAGHDMEACFTGDASLSKRPMGRVLKPLRRMGLATAEAAQTLPLDRQGHARPRPHRLRAPRGLGPSKVGGAACRASCPGPHHRDRADGEPRSYRAHVHPFRRRGDASRTRLTVAAPSVSAATPSLRASTSPCPAIRALPPLPLPRR